MYNTLKSTCFCIILFILFQSKPATASHALGAEFSYICLGSNTYQITYTLYRSCHGIVPADSIDLNINNDCGFANSNVYIFKTGSEIEISSTCPSSATECNGGPYFGVQKWTYQGIISLPGECEWTVSHIEAARVAALTTILGAGIDNLFTYCTINNLSALCNNSPIFTNDPVLNYCVSQYFSLRNNMYDIDGDSIAFEMIAPRTGLNSADTVTFYSSYSSQQPILSSFISWDAFSGELRFIATQADFTLAAFLVKEYRNGILIGETERDMIINIENCNNITPILTGFNGLPVYNINVYPNQQNCFFVGSVDSDINDSTFIYSPSSLLPGMSMTTTNSQTDSIYICWNPYMADTSSTYCFDLIVSDNNCPYLGINHRYYCMHVMNSVNVNEIESNDFEVWPNPFTSQINFTFKDEITSAINFEISIWDLQGRKLKNLSVLYGNTFQLNDLDAGVYLLNLKSKITGTEFHKKIIKG